jgi:hypothetical protein
MRVIADIASVVATCSLAPEARERLALCLPVLSDALDTWQDGGSFSAPGLMCVAATPCASAMVHSTIWALGNDGLDRGTVLHTLHRAIELDEPALLIASLSAALEEQGRAAAEADAAAISARGEQPLLIVLAASDGDAVSMLATTVAVPCPAEPSRMIH